VFCPPAAGMPTWQVSPSVHPLITANLQLFPPNIFHPPEHRHLSTLI
jgi:hypothetical protein